LVAYISLNAFRRNIEDPAFVRAIFDLGIIGTNVQGVQKELKAYLDIGSIGKLRVRRENFSVRDIGGM